MAELQSATKPDSLDTMQGSLSHSSFFTDEARTQLNLVIMALISYFVCFFLDLNQEC